MKVCRLADCTSGRHNNIGSRPSNTRQIDTIRPGSLLVTLKSKVSAWNPENVTFNPYPVFDGDNWCSGGAGGMFSDD